MLKPRLLLCALRVPTGSVSLEVTKSELQVGRVELGKLMVSRKLYFAVDLSLPPIEFDNA
jgi:hypothetical protein